jgi:hypothetical protein
MRHKYKPEAIQYQTTAFHLNSTLHSKFSETIQLLSQPPFDSLLTMAAPLQIGVLLKEVQLSDIIAVDILGNLSKQYNEAMEKYFQLSGFTELATPMTFHYISSSLSLTHMTPDIKFLPTVTYDEAPRNLDILAKMLYPDTEWLDR